MNRRLLENFDFILFFFFKQKTAYEIKECDWSSDVCSSDLILFKAYPESDPSWFGFLITIKDGVNFKRNDLVKYLEGNNIQTRNLFAGNITRHPCFEELKEGKDYRIKIGRASCRERV